MPVHKPTISEIIALCTNPEKDCFSGNKHVLEMMIDMDDSRVRGSLQRAGAWGFDAARAGLEIKGLNLHGKPIATAEVGPDNLSLQAARCGFYCGAIASGQCSVFKQSAFNKDGSSPTQQRLIN